MKKWLTYSVIGIFILSTMLGLCLVPNINYEKQVALAEEIEYSVEEDNELLYISIGDSLATGYKLPSWTNGNGASNECNPTTVIYDGTYTDYFADFLYEDCAFSSKNCVSYAKSGITSTDLVNQLQSDDNLREDIKKTDIITISIGLEDVMNMFYDDGDCNRALYAYLLKPIIDFQVVENVFSGWNSVVDFFGLGNDLKVNDSKDWIKNLIAPDADFWNYVMSYEEANSKIESSLQDVKNKLSENIDSIIKIISSGQNALNPNAKIIFTDIYNPFRQLFLSESIAMQLGIEDIEGIINFFCDLFSLASTVINSKILDIINVALKGATIPFMNIYGDLGKVFENSINEINSATKNKINSLSTRGNIQIAPVKEHFDNYAKTKDDNYDLVRLEIKNYIESCDEKDERSSQLTKFLEIFKKDSKANALYNPTLYGQRVIYESIKEAFINNFSVIIEDYSSKYVNGQFYKRAIITNTNKPVCTDSYVLIKNESGNSKKFIEKTVTNKQITKGMLSSLTNSDNGLIFVNWYQDKALQELYFPYDSSPGILIRVYAKWSQLNLLSEQVQYGNGTYKERRKFSFKIESDGQAIWYNNNKQAGQGDTFDYYPEPTNFGTYTVYCKINGVKSKEYTISYYYKPDKDSLKTTVTNKIISDPTTSTEYIISIEDAYKAYMDTSQIKWFKKATVSGEKTEITDSKNKLGVTLKISDQPYIISMEYGQDEIYSTTIKPYYNVRFNSGENNTSIDQYVLYGEKALRPVNPDNTEDGKIFSGWYSLDDVDNKKEWDFGEIITKDTTIYALYTNLIKNLNEKEFYSTNINDFMPLTFEIQAYSHVEDIWYVNGRQVENSDLTITDDNVISYDFKPSAFGSYHIYCSLDGEDFEGYDINYYQAPSSISINTSRTALNSYHLALNHDSTQLDTTKIKWYKINANTQEKEEICDGQLSTSIDIEIPYKILVEYNDGEFMRQYETEIINPYYIVSFYIENQKITEQEVELGSVATNLERTRNNYLLKSWYLDNNFAQTKKWDFDTPIQEDISLHAKWVQLTYDSNDSLVQYIKDVQSVDFSIDLHDKVTWVVEFNGVEKQQNLEKNNFEFTPDSMVGTYKVYCKLGNGVSNYVEISVIYYIPSSLTIGNEETDINTYIFALINDDNVKNMNGQCVQWYKKVNGKEYELCLNDEPLKYIITDDVEVLDYCLVYAKYDDGTKQLVSNEITITPYYLVRFISNEQIIYSEYVLRDNSVEEIPTAERYDYIFGGWYKDINYQLKFYNDSPILSDMSIYAKWVQIEFDNPLLETQYINSVQPTTFVLDLQGTAYWYVNGIYYGSTSSTIQNPKNVFTFTPTLGTVATYSVRCEINGKNANTQYINVQYYEPESIEVEMTENFRNTIEIIIADDNAKNINPSLFDWYIVDFVGNTSKLDEAFDDSITMLEYKTGVIIKLTEPCDIYLTYKNNEVGKYSLVPKYDVIFITHIGAPIIVPIEKYQLVTPQAITQNGYLFGGWFIDNNYLNEFDFNTQITEDIALYAKWVSVQCLNKDLLVQYENNISPVQFFIDIDNINIIWYVNDSLQLMHSSSKVFTYIPQSYGKYDVSCSLYEVKSNVISIMVYQIPTELEISKVKNKDNTYSLTISNLNADNIDQEKCLWMKSTKDGEFIQIGQGANLLTEVEEDCEIYLVYQNEDSQVVSNVLNIEKITPNNGSNSTLFIILLISGVLVCAGALFVYFKFFNKKPNLEPQPPVPGNNINIKETIPAKEKQSKKQLNNTTSNQVSRSSNSKINQNSKQNKVKPKTTKQSPKKK